jgi:predicted aspartyl protease
MILGKVNAKLDAVATLSVLDSADHVHPISTVVDTGFNGHLTLRPAMIARFGLPRTGAVRVQLADGSSSYRHYFGARVVWDGAARTVEALELETDPLLGMNMLSGARLTIDVVDGGAVTIDSIP